MRLGGSIAAGTAAAVAIAMLMVFAGIAQAQTAGGTSLSSAVPRLPVVGAWASQATAPVESAPVLGDVVRSAPVDAAQAVSSGDQGVATLHQGAAPIMRDLNHRAVQVVGSVDSSGGQVVAGAERMTAGAAPDRGEITVAGGFEHAPGLTGTPSTLTQETGRIGDVARAELANASPTAQAGVRNLTDASASFYTRLSSIIRAALAGVPVLPGLVAQVVDLVGQLRVFITSELGALTSHLPHDGSGTLTPSGFLRQDPPAGALVVTRDRTAWSSTVSRLMPTSSYLQALPAALAARADRVSRVARDASATPGSAGQRLALGSAMRAGAVATSGLPSAFDAIGGKGAFGSPGPFHGGVELPLMLLLLTLLIPAAWRLLRGVSHYRPVIFALPLERPG